MPVGNKFLCLEINGSQGKCRSFVGQRWWSWECTICKVQTPTSTKSIGILSVISNLSLCLQTEGQIMWKFKSHTNIWATTSTYINYNLWYLKSNSDISYPNDDITYSL